MEKFTQPISQFLRDQAMQLPETSEGTSCVNRAFKARKKNFLFVGEKEKESQVRIMLKLTDSLAAAQALRDPRIGVGTTGWLTIEFGYDDPVDADLLAGWVRESFRALAPKTLIKQLDTAGD